MIDETQIEADLFEALMALPDEAHRQRLMDAACEGKPALRQRVQELLDAAQGAGEFMQQPVVDLTEDTIEGALLERPGSQIGRYKLLEQIGEGGFGVVYMADQLRPIERRVALKIIKLGMDSKQVVARFEAERQALALMDHPNIAKILDAGTTETGRPYFVMELVRGIPVTEYCDDRKLSTEGRLRLFSQVCSAVQHAHQKGIIHRDIKPSNILVATNGDEPVPKVIDFGIAKATQGRLTDKTLFTQFRQFIGTPAYMSPEQAQMSAVDVDTRSDIYSLGVLLYELLTGQTPLDSNSLASSGYEEICRRIREEEAIKPSKRLSSLQDEELTTLAKQRNLAASQFSSSVQGDLDWIAMKAVEKDRSRRYSSADAMAKDVERYLNREPVSAVPPNALYVAKKFVRRHQRLLATAALIVATLLVATAVSSWFAVSMYRLSGDLTKEGIAKDHAIDEAIAAKKALSKQLAETQEARADAELSAYVSDLNLGYQAFERNYLNLSIDMLDKYRKKHSDSFEWKCLNWLVESGDSLAIIRDHQDEVLQVDVSKHGVIGSFARDRFVRLHDLKTRKQIDSWQHEHGLNCIEFSPDGDVLALGDQAGQITFWQVEPRRLLKSFTVRQVDPPKKTWLNDIAFSRTGDTVAVAHGEATDIWQWREEEKVEELPHGTARVDFSPNNDLLGRASAGGAQLFSITDSRTGEELGLVKQSHTSFLNDIRFSPNAKYVATSSWDSVVRLWDVEQVIREEVQHYGSPLAVMRGHTGPSTRLDFSPDGKWLASTSHDNSVRLWHGQPPVEDLERPVSTLRGHQRQTHDVAFSPDGRELVSVSLDKTIRIWPGAPTHAPNTLVGHQDFVFGVGFSPDCKLLASGSFDGEVRMWDSQTQELLFHEFLHDHQVFNTVFSPDGKWLASCSCVWRTNHREGIDFDTPGKVIVTNVNSRKSHVVELPKPAGVRAITFLPNGLLIIGDFQGTLWLWDIERKTVVNSRIVGQEGEGGIDGVCCSRDGELIAVAFWPHRISGGKRRLFTYRGDELTEVSEIVSYASWRIAFAPDSIGKNLVASGVGFLDVMRGEVSHLWAGRESGSIAFSPDGKTMATSGMDQRIHLWNVAAESEVASISAHRGMVMCLEFSPDGTMLASASEDGTIRIWRTAVSN